jgi:PAS domain S-box-containing protein
VLGGLLTGLLVLATLVAVAGWAQAGRRQTALMQAMREAEAAAQAATARAAALAEREHFGKELSLSLQARVSLQGFGATLLQALCRRLDARAAAFHCFDASADAYVLTAHYAVGEGPAFVERYRAGEGLAGQAALDRQQRVCGGVAADWMWVGSGTQVSAAVTLIITPVVNAGQVSAVVELALMRNADDEALALIDEVQPVVALNLATLQSRLQMLNELARSRALETRLRTLFDTANEGIWIIDPEARTTDLNPALAAILGLPREAVLGHTIFEFVDEANAAVFRDQIEHRRHGETGSYEIALLRPDRSPVPCLFDASPLIDANGKPIGSFAMVANLTRYRQAAG